MTYRIYSKTITTMISAHANASPNSFSVLRCHEYYNQNTVTQGSSRQNLTGLAIKPLPFVGVVSVASRSFHMWASYELSCARKWCAHSYVHSKLGAFSRVEANSQGKDRICWCSPWSAEIDRARHPSFVLTTPIVLSGSCTPWSATF